MAVRDILKMGNPLLQQASEPVTEFATQELSDLIVDLKDTMEAANGAGIAAPQIGVLKQVVMFGVQSNPRYPDAEPVPFTILINPSITILSNVRSAYWEGCLSVPGMRGLVERPNHINYSGFNQFGDVVDREATGFHATVVQHECDHLNGVLYPMRIRDMSYFGFSEEIDKLLDDH
ncbi:peptide deformylase [Aliikangiella marina]|uniref:Peptide deformylase n=1 Tax=Aliikangiella marina TaxID=1712262 RepID=A0A545TD32_9GAMM|nr:peptide deformylase [Aliikangiella marina]TQV75086.1 peptide deformylase [Aliikangiella marina]